MVEAHNCEDSLIVLQRGTKIWHGSVQVSEKNNEKKWDASHSKVAVTNGGFGGLQSPSERRARELFREEGQKLKVVVGVVEGLQLCES